MAGNVAEGIKDECQGHAPWFWRIDREPGTNHASVWKISVNGFSRHALTRVGIQIAAYEESIARR